MKVLHPTAMRQGADYVRSMHHIDVTHDPDMTIKDVLTPGFWKHHTERMRPGDMVDVLGPGFDITLRVRDKGLGFVNTYLLRVWEDPDYAKQPESQGFEGNIVVPDGYMIDHTPRTLWRVRMTPEGTEVSRNHKTKADAAAAARDHFAKIQGIAA